MRNVSYPRKILSLLLITVSLQFISMPTADALFVTHSPTVISWLGSFYNYIGDLQTSQVAAVESAPVVQAASDPLSVAINGELPDNVQLDVPFSSQAPTGDWRLPYQEACEETSLIMVEYFFRKEPLTAELANEEIVKVTDFVTSKNLAVDITAGQVLEVSREYYNRPGYLYYNDDVTIQNLKRLLASGYPIIIPASGYTLNNPNYTGAGPPYHMIVLIGYNENGFISHDPGTQFGGSYVYSYETINNAIHDWAGRKDNVLEGQRVVLVLSS